MGRANWKLVPHFLYGAHKYGNKGYFTPEMYNTTHSAHTGSSYVNIKVTPNHIGRNIMEFVQTKKIPVCPDKARKLPSKKGHKKTVRTGRGGDASETPTYRRPPISE